MRHLNTPSSNRKAEILKRYRIGDEDLDPMESKIVADVEQFGWHVMGVMGTETTQEFAYTIGVYQSFDHPEIALFGVPFREAHAILNDLIKTVQGGAPFEPRKVYSELLDGASCIFVPAASIWHEACFGRAIDFYGSLDFPVLQCVWSDAAGRFPWNAEFDQRLFGLQPNLSVGGVQGN